MKKRLLIILSIPLIFVLLVVILIFSMRTDCSKVEPEFKYYELGQTATTEYQNVKLEPGSLDNEENYTDIFRTDSYKQKLPDALLHTYKYAPTGSDFILIKVTVWNYQQKSVGINRKDFTLYDAFGHKYPTVNYNGRKSFNSGNLQEGTVRVGVIAFQIPESAEDLHIRYTLPGSPPLLSIWNLPD